MTDSVTPMVAQYRRMRAELPPDTLLFFRLGDFYELFYDDALEASRLLDITLTRRQSAPMCGVPYHSAESYIARLIRAGKKVAICEQMEDPAQAKGIVRREIVRVVTPGAVLEDQVLESRRNNWLAALLPAAGGRYGLALLDLSTGEFRAEECADAAAAREALLRCAPAELLAPAGARDGAAVRAALPDGGGPALSAVDDWRFEPDVAAERLTRHFGVQSLDGFGLRAGDPAVGAAGAALYYVTDELRRGAAHVRALRPHRAGDYLLLDDATVRNLELVAPRDGGAGPCLLRTIDATVTAMGARRLRDWLLRPLCRPEDIRRRQRAVAAAVADRARLAALRETLEPIRDIERLLARLSAGLGNARDVRALAESLRQLPGARAAAAGLDDPLLNELAADIEPQPALLDEIDRALVDEPPLPLKEGGLIRAGYHAELDELRAAAGAGRQWLAHYQAAEQERTGIKSLKIRHNQVFGYYIEVSHAQRDAVPPDYTRKQTLANCERFITPALKEYENKILGAQERSVALEYELFLALRGRVAEAAPALQRAAAALGTTDALAALADRALALRYTRPEIGDHDRLVIRDGRHPVIETLPDAERFVPNDTRLDGGENRLAILTGPNMAGKSTYIRQVALIVILAQMGSFVPAAAAEIGVVDRVFTRVGAGDDLARGRSTFMVEMQETANILHNATPRSLIVLDEIGRGTSTFDGISIAWAVAEYLHNEPSVRAKTLFATHYHELTDLARTLPGVKNYCVLVRESGDRIAFLRKIVPGAADKSYGIHVARLAGLPEAVIRRAGEILENLEEGEFGETGQPQLARRRPPRGAPAADDHQLRLF